MTLHCAFIGFGKSTTRYHLPYVLNRKDSWHVAHIYRRSAKPEEQSPQYSHIHFTSDLNEVWATRRLNWSSSVPMPTAISTMRNARSRRVKRAGRKTLHPDHR